jgi:diguanylate cyclase (GGDEF)-like protein
VRTSDEIGYLTEVFNRMTTTLKKNVDSLEQLSVTDELTKLCNRRQLGRALAEEVARARRNCRPLSLIMIDIDHFKRYNDTFGHLRGDAVLESFGAFLLANLRATDIPARYGGEEFVVVLPETDIAEALAKAERLREGFTESVDDAHEITLSLGVAAWPGDGDSDLELIEAADRALYAAKDRGRDRVVVYSELSR